MSDDATAEGPDGVDRVLASLDDWRGTRLSTVRALIHRADANITESIKWRKPTNPLGVPTWELDGIICTGECYADKVKLTFASGAALRDPDGLFNASLGGSTRRAIDLREDDALPEDAFIALVHAAAAHNRAG